MSNTVTTSARPKTVFQQLKAKLNESARFTDGHYTNQHGIQFTVNKCVGSTNQNPEFKRGGYFTATFTLEIDKRINPYGNLTVTIPIHSDLKCKESIEDITVHELFNAAGEVARASNDCFSFDGRSVCHVSVHSSFFSGYYTRKKFTLSEMLMYTREQYLEDRRNAEKVF